MVWQRNPPSRHDGRAISGSAIARRADSAASRKALLACGVLWIITLAATLWNRPELEINDEYS
jgi:hypothetical protein